MKILVTGGAGFIGYHLIKKLISLNHNVVSIDDYSNGFKENHIDGCTYLEGHTIDIEHILISNNETHFDVLFHLGERSRIVPSFSNIKDIWDSNSTGTFNVIEYCRKNSIKIIYAGSSTKFVGEGVGHSPYSFIKAKSSDLIKYYSDWYGLNYVICYFYNVFGYRQIHNFSQYESVIDIFMYQYKKNLPLSVCGNGLQQRTFVYVEDIVDGLIKSIDYPYNEEFQLNSLKEYSILEIANMISNRIEFLPERPGDRMKNISTNNKSRELLNWNTTMDIDNWISKIKNEL